MSVLSERSGRELFISTDSSTREYYPEGIPFALMVTVAEVEELLMDINVSSEPVFWRRLIANLFVIASYVIK